jgi:predicted ATPase/DNA-binding XRE family transcriptional regulator
MQPHSFGDWLKHRRKALDLTQAALASQVGYSAAAIRKIEAEERRPSAQIVERLAEIFAIPENERTKFLRFARGELRSAPAETKEIFPWHTTARSTLSNLPAAVTSFIGREKEIAEVRDYLLSADIHLLTLIGPPGIGKTRLSIETARMALPDFPDGVFFVALAPLDDPTLIAVTIAQALGYMGAGNMSTSEQLIEGIGDKQMLIVLDNCEHLIEDLASLASGLLSACSHLKILATSRESLRIPGEWLYAAPAFDLPADSSSLHVENASEYPALALFAERARAVHSDFSLNPDNIKTIAAICAHLDGLPLVIELIAARTRLMSPQALLDRLSAQFVLTADGMRAASERQKTLHNAIEWSYNLLSPEEQKLFAYLSVFSSGFTLDAVEAMFSQKVTEKPLPNLVSLLLDKSLLKLAPNPESSSEARYTMLMTIQEYAREHLREMGEETEIRNLHLAYFLALAEKGDKEMRGPNQIEWLHRLGSMRDNFRAALQWMIETRQTEAALQMARKLHWFSFVRGDHTEGRHWLGRVLAMPDAPLYPESCAEALTQLAHHTWLIIGSKEARPFVEQALAIARAHGDKENIARALAVLGLVLTFEHNFALAELTLEESMALFQEVDDKWGYAHAVICLALGPSMQDDRATALTLHEQALVLFREVGDRYFQGVSLRHIGDLRVKEGDGARGAAALREALTLAQQLDSKYEIGACLWNLGYAVQRAGNSARAVHLYGAAKNFLDLIGAWNEREASEFENDLAPCRAALDESEFATAMEQGRAMTMEQVIAFALENNDA